MPHLSTTKKLPFVSPLIILVQHKRLSQKQSTKNNTSRWPAFVLFMSFFSLPSFAYTSSLSVVLRDCQHEDVWPFAIKARSGQPLLVFFSQRNRSCTGSICADICTGVSADFLPNFHYRMFMPFPRVLVPKWT